jgi:hypothetical protein
MHNLPIMEDDPQINWKERYFDLLKKVEVLEARITALENENRQLKLENQSLRVENQSLREKLNMNSNNSSKPPSQDPFRKTRSNYPSGRKQGGQPGHPGHRRDIYPTEQVTKIINLKPDSCPSCGSTNFDATPIFVECRQVVELPVIQPEVTHYTFLHANVDAVESMCAPRFLPKRKGVSALG